ncbi:MAG: hypothetical protein E2O50_06980 [Gammaproteobacteria bacterium]|nr:MAG: hypothetical protein E2O50_06980 [Gammaproteobacteria bacterium]
MSSYHLVNVWTDTGLGSGGFNPMASSMLWLPDGHHLGHPAPAFVYLHRWGGYPYDPLPTKLGPELADKGFAVLSLCLRRRGMEGQLAAMPDHDLQDIKLAIDYLYTNGFNQVFLVGENIGGLSALMYTARHRDSRVGGICWLNPLPGPADWLSNAVGKEAYDAAVANAGIAARQGAGMDVRIDLFPHNAPAITQNSLAFLSWWGPMAETSLERCLQDSAAPLCVITVEQALPAALAEAPGGSAREVLRLEPGKSAESLVDWAVRQGAELISQCSFERVDTISDGAALFGLLWSPAEGKPVKTATLLIHGLSSSPLSPLFLKLAPVLAQTGTAVLAVESRRSGWAGHETSMLENDVADIDAWVSLLVERGYEKIVLAGASIGSISVGRYQSVRQHPNVAAIAHLMPTADCPDWFRRAAGDGPYLAAVEQAKAAVANGEGEQQLIDIDVRQPPPSKSAGRFRWTQRAASWLSWWGPEADSRNIDHIANARVPLLLLSGTDDSYNDEARFAELKAAAVNAPRVDEIWYPNIDHGLAGVETRVARDLYKWMSTIDVV